MGYAPSLITAKFWVTSGLIKVNGKIYLNNWHTVHLHDFVELDPTVWKLTAINLVKILFYGSRAARRRRCISSKLWNLRRISRAHFIGLHNYTYSDT